MKIAITGGTGFVGRNIARTLVRDGHEAVLLARGQDTTDTIIRQLANAHFVAAGVENTAQLTAAFSGCDAVVHCAGINRETGAQTYERVHVTGTRNVVLAARAAGVRKVALISFLRARPDCGSAYHESKWAAEEIVRNSGLDYTVLKCGVIYGKGDHMLNHLSHAFYTFPVFAFVGFNDKNIRPNAVEDVAEVVARSVTGGILSRRTVAVLGPEELTLRSAVRRVAKVVGKRPLMFPLPVWFHYMLGWFVERIMKTPLVSVAQVKMLSEGLSEPCPPCELLPSKLAPKIRFTETQIRQGLPTGGGFGLRDIRCRGCRNRGRCTGMHTQRVFLEMP
ncbi:MAG TPA: SDR family NAD(P)-dependent oxidoreductase [Verrucomicrobiae bacterium]|nr:SDR family NAD(P)-dependent oxidoreductase [Verrucomicrobiae bacterium]